MKDNNIAKEKPATFIVKNMQSRHPKKKLI